MSSSIPLRLKWLLCVFVLSGFAGLIYQSIWSHYLGLFLGHAAYAQALVLAIFMGGMALGAALVARVGQGWRNLIRTYALIEAVIGVLALVFHWVFTGAVGFSYDSVIPTLGQPWLVGAYKWLLAGLLILPQTILLGMTFPLMSGGIIRRYSGGDGSILGGLYFTNSIGAALGVLAGAFIFMPMFGLQGAILIAGCLNLVVAALAWWLGRGNEEARNETIAGKHNNASLSDERRRLLKIVLMATFFSGAASFAYEIIWIRMLSLAVGSTLHAFELMLAAFIAGIAFGGLWIKRRADGARDPMRLVGWLQVLMGIAALASLFFYANAFSWVGFLMESLARTDGGYNLFNVGTALIAVLIMMPAAFFAGTTLPIFTVILLRDGQGESSIGRVYAWNTLGAILGVFATIHLLIPILGLKLALVLAALLDILIGIALLRINTFTSRQFVATGLATGLAFICLISAITLVHFDPMRLSAGVYRTGNVELTKDEKVVFYRDGKTASVATIQNNKNGHLRISTNGKVDAAIAIAEGAGASSDEPTMVLLSAIPMAYMNNPERVGIIGFGSGLSTHTVLADARVKRVDTVEIEPAMVDGARFFGERVARAYQDSRSHIVIDDAKSHFSSQRQKYDLIISEPSNPWISGVGSLFSKEFYGFVPKLLNENGVFVQWLQLYEIDEQLVGSVLNAMTPAFKDYEAYLANDSDLVIIASPNKKLNSPDFESLFSGEMRADLNKVGVAIPEQIKLRKIADASMLQALSRLYAYRANSDYFPVLSMHAPRTRYMKKSAGLIAGLSVMDLPLLEVLGISEPLSEQHKLGPEWHFSRYQAIAQARMLAHALRSDVEPDLSTLDLDSLQLAAGLRKISTCSEPWGDAQESKIVARTLHVMNKTLANLPPTEQDGILISPSWVRCNKLPTAYSDALKIIESLARRDYSSADLKIRTWFDTRESRGDTYKVFDSTFFASLQLSQMALGRYENIRLLEDSYGKNIKSEGEPLIVRSLLMAWVDDASVK